MKFKEIQEITEKMDWEMRVDAIEEFVMFHLPLADYYVYLCDTTPDETIADLRFHAEEFAPENYLLRSYDRSKAAVDKANYIKASLMNLSAELMEKAEETDGEYDLLWDEDDAFDDPKLRNASTMKKFMVIDVCEYQFGKPAFFDTLEDAQICLFNLFCENCQHIDNANSAAVSTKAELEEAIKLLIDNDVLDDQNNFNSLSAWAETQYHDNWAGQIIEVGKSENVQK